MNTERPVEPVLPRLVAFPGIKFIGLSLGMTVFFAGYFWVLQHPHQTPHLMPLTVIDHAIGFQPGWIWAYLSLWLYVSLAPALMIARRELAAYAAFALALGGAGLAIFYVWPTAVPPLLDTWAPDSAFAFLKRADASGNACPSLHVAFAVFTAQALARTLRAMNIGPGGRSLNWLWCAAIVYSTLATRQHVAWDVLAGAALGILAGWLHSRFLAVPTRPRAERAPG